MIEESTKTRPEVSREINNFNWLSRLETTRLLQSKFMPCSREQISYL